MPETPETVGTLDKDLIPQLRLSPTPNLGPDLWGSQARGLGRGFSVKRRNSFCENSSDDPIPSRPGGGGSSVGLAEWDPLERSLPTEFSFIPYPLHLSDFRI